MGLAGWITMIVVTVVVWGGFLVLLSLALRKEAGKELP